MITAIYSSVILDVATNDSQHGSRSAKALKLARKQGRIIVSAFVIAEIAPICGQQTDGFLESLNIQFVPTTKKGSLHAGKMFTNYLARGGKRGRIVADFLIGTHAAEHADRLLTRNAGFLRDYFTKAVIWYP